MNRKQYGKVYTEPEARYRFIRVRTCCCPFGQEVTVHNKILIS
jgi:hypothetical protein